jgi:hypothetical protein
VRERKAAGVRASGFGFCDRLSGNAPLLLGIALGDLAMAGIFTIVGFLPQEGLPRRAPVKRHYRQNQLS